MHNTHRSSEPLFSGVHFCTTFALSLQINLGPMISFSAHKLPTSSFQTSDGKAGNTNGNTNTPVHWKINPGPGGSAFALRPGSRGELQPRPPVSGWVLVHVTQLHLFSWFCSWEEKRSWSGCVQTAFLSSADAVTEGDHIFPHVARKGHLPLAAPTWLFHSLARRLTSRQGPWCHEVSIFYGKHVSCYKAMQAHLRDAVDSTPDHNKASHINFFGFPVHIKVMGSPGGTIGKEPACQCRRCKRCRFDPWVQ